MLSAIQQESKPEIMSYGPRHTNVYASGSGSNTTISAHTTSNTNINTSFLRQPNQTQSALQTRINSKRAELENLSQLRDLSANLANQLSTLEQKLGTLKDGAHSVALVLANWENVLRAINMAASMFSRSLFLRVLSYPVLLCPGMEWNGTEREFSA